MSIDKNPFEELVRLLETRLVRQKGSIVVTEHQLEGARQSFKDWANAQSVLPFEKKDNKK